MQMHYGLGLGANYGCCYQDDLREEGRGHVSVVGKVCSGENPVIGTTIVFCDSIKSLKNQTIFRSQLDREIV
jgi:hypothetical protein